MKNDLYFFHGVQNSESAQLFEAFQALAAAGYLQPFEGTTQEPC